MVFSPKKTLKNSSKAYKNQLNTIERLCFYWQDKDCIFNSNKTL